MIDLSKVLGSVASAAGSAFLGPVGALAGPIIGAIGNGAFNAAAVERERAWSEKMYNKYNSPAALVRQYQQAGINPALMFGQSAIPASTTSTAAQAPANPFGDVVGMLGQLMQLDLLDANKRNIEADIENKQSDTENKRADTVGKNIANEFQPELLRQSLEKGELDIQQGRLALDKIVAEISDINASADLKAAQKVLAWANTALAKMQTDESYSRIGVNNVNALLIGQQRVAQELDNLYQREFGVEPGAGFGSQIVGLIKSRAFNLRSRSESEIGSVKEGLHVLGAKALSNISKMSAAAKSRWEYLSSSLGN